jgi:glutamate N-acetyltransferase/amino-acid N-acetyltransferase
MSAHSSIKYFEGGVTAPAGFSAAGIKAGIKHDKKDMALIVADCVSAAAGVFTLNSVKAAPVLLCQRHLRKSRSARAIIVNSGNANACTGPKGLADAASMAALTGAMLNIDPALVLVCSTGTIGLPLPMQKIKAGIRRAVENLGRAGGSEAARAIMTTDTVPKQAGARLRLGGKKIIIGAMAKGAGMIAPNMATLLVFITTDAALERSALQAALARAVENSFNRILVDGDQSTNDTVLCLANGLAGNKPVTRAMPDWDVFTSALTAVCRKLAGMIVKDGEGVTKVVKIEVNGARNDADAEKAARSIARSQLVKTSWFGADPNWGRVICAVGYSGARVVPGRIDIFYNGRPAVKKGVSAGLAPDKLHKIIAGKEFAISVNLHQGRGSYSILTCDCSIEYVRINADYMT